ncbi:MAG TPA: hypothetical protein VGQ83_28310 [Polyangia bacterium]
MAFKSCSFCRREWETLDEFARDPECRPLGLVVHFKDAYRSLLLFNHSCGTTLAVRADDFRDRMPPLEGPLLAGSDGCHEHCLRFGDLEPCDQPCRNAPLRRLMADMSRRHTPGDGNGNGKR